LCTNGEGKRPSGIVGAPREIAAEGENGDGSPRLGGGVCGITTGVAAGAGATANGAGAEDVSFLAKGFTGFVAPCASTEGPTAVLAGDVGAPAFANGFTGGPGILQGSQITKRENSLLETTLSPTIKALSSNY
jgi:hypothetical protein